MYIKKKNHANQLPATCFAISILSSPSFQTSSGVQDNIFT